MAATTTPLRKSGLLDALAIGVLAAMLRARLGIPRPALRVPLATAGALLVALGTTAMLLASRPGPGRAPTAPLGGMRRQSYELYLPGSRQASAPESRAASRRSGRERAGRLAEDVPAAGIGRSGRGHRHVGRAAAKGANQPSPSACRGAAGIRSRHGPHSRAGRARRTGRRGSAPRRPARGATARSRPARAR